VLAEVEALTQLCCIPREERMKDVSEGVGFRGWFTVAAVGKCQPMRDVLAAKPEWLAARVPGTMTPLRVIAAQVLNGLREQSAAHIYNIYGYSPGTLAPLQNAGYKIQVRFLGLFPLLQLKHTH
jgi:hypothetical protein